MQRVWDIPLRLFHWLLVILIGFSWWSAENHEMEWHQLSGFAVAGLIAFRIIWGFAGSNTARFAQFIKGPGAIWRYVRGKDSQTSLGHNPLGAMSVIALLSLIATIIALGQFAVDVDGIESGPLSFLVDFDQGRFAAEWHHELFEVLLALIGLHVLSILFYLAIKRRNLITPMLTGLKPLGEGEFVQPLAAAPTWRLAITLIAAAAFGWAMSKGFWIQG